MNATEAKFERDRLAAANDALRFRLNEIAETVALIRASHGFAVDGGDGKPAFEWLGPWIHKIEFAATLPR